MRKELEDLVGNLKALEDAKRMEAQLQVAMLLERHFIRVLTIAKTGLDNRDDKSISSQIVPYDYGPDLPPELLSLELSDDEAKEIVGRMFQLLASSEANPSLIWALGKVPARIGLEPILGIMTTYSDKLDDLSACQAVYVLENYLSPGADGKISSELKTIIAQKDPTRFLAKSSSSANSRLSTSAQRVLKKLQERL